MSDFNLKDYMVVGDVITNYKNLPVKVWVQAKVDAEKMFEFFEKRKDKNLSEWDFFKKIIEDSLELPLKVLKEHDSEKDFFISIHLAMKEDESDNNL